MMRFFFFASILACATPSSTPPTKEPPMTVSDELDWVGELVSALATGTFTNARAVAFLGDDAGVDPSHEDGRVVRPRAKSIASASVYPLTHIQTPVAIDVTFAKGSEPSLDALARKVGELRAMPRAPDDFSSGQKLARYVERADTKTTVRVIAELDRESKHVAKIFFDAYTRK